MTAAQQAQMVTMANTIVAKSETTPPFRTAPHTGARRSRRDCDQSRQHGANRRRFDAKGREPQKRVGARQQCACEQRTNAAASQANIVATAAAAAANEVKKSLSMSSTFDLPQIASQTVAQLGELWDQLGEPANDRERHVQQLCADVVAIYNNLVTAQRKRVTDVQTRIDLYQSTIAALANELAEAPPPPHAVSSIFAVLAVNSCFFFFFFRFHSRGRARTGGPGRRTIAAARRKTQERARRPAKQA